MEAPELTGFARALLAVEREPERVLEVECGTGDATLFLAREYPHARVRGADSDEGAVREAASRVGLDPEGRVAFKPGGAAALPFPDDHFDLVTQRRGRLAPAELARVTRPGGLLLVRSDARANGPFGFPRPAPRALRRLGFEPLPGEPGDFLLMRLSGARRAPRRD